MDTAECMSDQEILKILDEAAEQYRHYIAVQELCDLSVTQVVVDYSARDMNYPLGIVWQGRGNGVLERASS